LSTTVQIIKILFQNFPTLKPKLLT